MPRKKRGNEISEDDRRHIARVIAHYNTPGIIKAERKRRGMSQTHLAAEMGLSLRYIVQLENNQKPISQLLCLAFHALFTIRIPHRETLPMAYDIPVTDLSLLFDAVRKLARIKDANTVKKTPATVPFEGLACIMTKLDIYCKTNNLHPSALLDHLTALSAAMPPSPRGTNDWQRYNVSPLSENGFFDQDAADFLKDIDPEQAANAINDDIKKLEDWMKTWNPTGDYVEPDSGLMLFVEARSRWDLRAHAAFLLSVVEYRRASNYPPGPFEAAVPMLVERLRPYHEGLDLKAILDAHAAAGKARLEALERGEEVDTAGPGIPRAEFERRQQEQKE